MEERIEKLLRSPSVEDLLIALNLLSTMTEEEIKSILKRDSEEVHFGCKYPNIWHVNTIIPVGSIYLLIGPYSLVWVDDPIGWNYPNIISNERENT